MCTILPACEVGTGTGVGLAYLPMAQVRALEALEATTNHAHTIADSWATQHPANTVSTPVKRSPIPCPAGTQQAPHLPSPPGGDGLHLRREVLAKRLAVSRLQRVPLGNPS